jgi:hypothetical protein
VIVLDENIADDQRRELRSWGIRVRQIGIDIARAGIQDESIIPLLIDLPRPTLITRDVDFGHPRLCHPSYGIIYLEVGPREAATFARRALRHPRLNTTAKRLGTVVRVSPAGIRVWRRNRPSEWLTWQ